jgi:IS1 family transposase
MNKLTRAKRSQILHLLVEGNSLRSTSRIADVSLNTATKLLIDAGKACAAHHDRHVRGVAANRVQCDEIWSFIGVKAKNRAKSKRAIDPTAGDVWTWTAIESETKLIISYLVGGRDAEYAMALMDDLRQRVTTRMQLTTDGHAPYLAAVEESFGSDIDFATLVKQYGAPPVEAEAARRYSPSECIGTRKTKITGNPDPKHISTSYVERQNLTLRMMQRRFTRLTNGFSKKLENHAFAVALHMTFYNFARIQKTLRVTPAMAAGIASCAWDIGGIVDLVERAERLRDGTLLVG